MITIETPASIYIPAIDGKDLYLANHTVKDNANGFTLRYPSGDMNLRKFHATIPYSLDSIKLREVYEKVYRNMRFSFMANGKEYTSRVITVTFNYSVKQFNKLYDRTYVRAGYTARDVTLTDCAYVVDGELIAVKCGEPVSNPLPHSMLDKYFKVRDGCYVANPNMPTVLSVADVRRELYEHGFWCDGVHYVRYKRSAGSARVGRCLFIDENLYSRMHRYDMCGLSVHEGDKVDLAALESYISLTSSSIIGTIELDPRHILVIDDYESVFPDDVVATSVVDGKAVTQYTKADVCNSIWDGQSLIQTEAMAQYGQFGFILLRNHFFKSACFNCDIQQFFRDHGITRIDQLNGTTRAERLEDIELITTPSSIKYLKFGSLDDWINNISSVFGVVKHEKPTHFFDGRFVQTHYQLLNTLQLTQEEVNGLLEPSFDYVRKLKTDPSVLRNHIKYPDEPCLKASPLLNKNDVVYRLLGVNDAFIHTKEYADFRNDLVRSYIKDLRKGKVLVNGNYSTLCGNPIEMLYASIGQFNGESVIGVGNVMSTRFEPGVTLLGSRSPHITIANVWLTHNTCNEEVTRYFTCTPEILYMNSIRENVLQRLSGCDFDSDTVLLTDHPLLIKAAERNFRDFEVPTSMLESAKIPFYYTNKDKAELDIRTSVNKIGEIINLSQELNSRLWDMVNHGVDKHDPSVRELYKDIAQLDIMSGAEIDSAKRVLPIDNAKELSKLKEKYRVYDERGRKVRPNFFAPIAKDKGYYDTDRINYKRHETPMDYMQKAISRFRAPVDNAPVQPLSSVCEVSVQYKAIYYGQIRRIIKLVRDANAQVRMIWGMDQIDGADKHAISADIREECCRYIGGLTITDSTAYWLIKAIEMPENSDVSKLLFYTLFGSPNLAFFRILAKNATGVDSLYEDPEGDISLYGITYSRMPKLLQK